MAHKYVRSGAGGAATGADWANAYLTLAAALTGSAAGDTIWVAGDHAESTAGAVTLTSPGTAASPCLIHCVDHTGTVPPVAADLRTTATVTSTGTNAISFLGFAYCYGISFSGATTGTSGINIVASAASGAWKFEACQLACGSSSSAGFLVFGMSSSSGNFASKVELINTTLKFAHAGQQVTLRMVDFSWRNTASAIAGATLPTVLFGNPSVPSACTAQIEGVDLSALGAGKTIINPVNSPQKYYLKDCQLGASVTISATPTAPGAEVFVTRCSDTAGNYIEQKYSYQGTQTDETTIVRTGGASDGTTPKSRKVVTTANAKWIAPFECPPLAIWNDSLASVTLTLYGIWGGGAVPNNDDIWMDVEYLGASGNPLGSFATATKASNLAANAALTADGSTWGGSTTAFKMSLTFTPQQKGLIYIYPKAGAASETFYIDPRPELS